MSLLLLRRPPTSLAVLVRHRVGLSCQPLARRGGSSKISSGGVIHQEGMATKKAPPPGTAQPVPGDEGSMFIQEGQASMIFPKGNEVFYNKVQVRRTDWLDLTEDSL